MGPATRSVSMFGNNGPKKVAPIEGSFICLDETRRELSDLGNYRNQFSSAVVPFKTKGSGDHGRGISLIDRKSRFNTNVRGGM